MNRDVSVIICTLNRCSTLDVTLDSLSRQRGLEAINYEVIVVDNGSTDKTKETVELAKPKFAGRLQYVFESHKGLCNARNRGIMTGSGRILVFTDDDVVIDENWLQIIYGVFQEKNCDGVGGRVLPVYPDNCPAWVKENAVKLSGSVVIYDYGEGDRKLDDSMFGFIGANFAFKKELFEKYGLFRVDWPKVGEDREIVRRFLHRKKSLYYCGRAVVHHPVDLKRLSLRFLAKWNIALGRSTARHEYESAEKDIASLGGVPRYLWRRIVSESLGLIVSVFNKPAFFDKWRSLFRSIGMLKEYRDRFNKVEENG